MAQIYLLNQMDPIFFPTPTDFRKWLNENHDQSEEKWVGFYKKRTGKPSITWPQSVDEALCYGWIDGLRKSIDKGELYDPLHPEKTEQPLECGEYQKSCEVEEVGTNGQAWHGGI